MKIGFIGAGKVGTAFGIYLKNNGFNISGYYSRTEGSALNAAKLSASACFSSLRELAENTDIIFITVHDNQIESICDKLTDYLNQNHIVVHMSGALSSAILVKAKILGCSVYSLHPLQAFTDINEAIKQLRNTYFSLEGDNDKIHILKEILNRTNNKFFIIEAENKVLYHASACIFSNFLVELMHQGTELLNTAGIDKEEGFKAMLPLIYSTLSNIENFGVEAALTGPIARGDDLVIKEHIENIQLKAPEHIDFYKYMSAKTLALAKQNKLKDKNKIYILEKILNGGI